VVAVGAVFNNAGAKFISKAPKTIPKRNVGSDDPDLAGCFFDERLEGFL
jgi:hypothetical protein